MKKTIYYENQPTNYSVSDDGKVFNDITGKELKGSVSDYKRVQLMINGEPKSLLVHRLVAEAFIPNPDGLQVVDHIDRNKMNNIVSNLRWSTVRDNSLNCERKTIPVNSKKLDKNQFNENDWHKIFNDENDDTYYLSYYANGNGEILNKKTMNILSGTERNGYIRININGNCYSAHRLVWQAFYGPIQDNLVIDHIDGNKKNNNISNLRAVTLSKNMNNAYKNGHSGQVGIKKYSKDGTFIQEYENMAAAAKDTNVTHAAIRSASERKGTCGGYFWIRNDLDFSIQDVLKESPVFKPYSSGHVKVNQYDKSMNFIKSFDTIASAAREINVSYSAMSKAVKNKKLYKDFYWLVDNNNDK